MITYYVRYIYNKPDTIRTMLTCYVTASGLEEVVRWFAVNRPDYKVLEVREVGEGFAL